MNYQAAIALAESELTDLVANKQHGRSNPDATTTLDRTVYSGKLGVGCVVTVTLKALGKDITITRHLGPENRDKPDLSFDAAKATAIAAYKGNPETVAAFNKARTATTFDDLLHTAETLTTLAPVPQSLANWRVKAVLDIQGLTATVDAAIAAMPEGAEKVVISRAWNGNGDVRRDSPTVQSFKAILGLTDAQVDAMFRTGASFNP